MPGVLNTLLAAMGLPSSLASRLQPVAMPVRTVIFDAQRSPRHVHFLTSGLASTVVNMSSGEVIEVGLTGHEGMPEATHLLGQENSPTQCFMQVEGTALRMGFYDFQQEFVRYPTVVRQVLRYVQYENFVSSQLCACARLHEVEERLSRWLLMVADRIGSHEFHLTQEFLAEMIGARRSSVTLAAGTLQRSGLIDYRRGFIRIRDRDGLEAVACECYTVVRQLYYRLTGSSYAGDHSDAGLSVGSPHLGKDHAEDEPAS